MKRFTKQANKFKEVLLSYSNRTIKSKSPDFWVLWYCTPDFTDLGERLRCLRRAGERYSVYVISITLWKADNGKEKSQRCH